MRFKEIEIPGAKLLETAGRGLIGEGPVFLGEAELGLKSSVNKHLVCLQYMRPFREALRLY